MVQDEKLNQRIREVLQDEPFVEERSMFGGCCFLYRGNMVCGADSKNGLMVRVGPDQYEAALKLKHAREMTFTGRPMKGFVFVDGAGYATKRQLKSWVAKGMVYAESLPAKEMKSKTRRKTS